MLAPWHVKNTYQTMCDMINMSEWVAGREVILAVLPEFIRWLCHHVTSMFSSGWPNTSESPSAWHSSGTSSYIPEVKSNLMTLLAFSLTIPRGKLKPCRTDPASKCRGRDHVES